MNDNSRTMKSVLQEYAVRSQRQESAVATGRLIAAS